MSEPVIRPAREGDLPALGRLGASLLCAHFAFDQQRFMAPGADPEGAYAWFLGSQLQLRDVVVLVAEEAGSVAGYVYAGIEPLSWKELRDEAGFIHDLVVDEAYRRRGIGEGLLQAAIEWFTQQGVPRVLLWTAGKNTEAQRLFSRLGFRETMIEMTLDFGQAPKLT